MDECDKEYELEEDPDAEYESDPEDNLFETFENEDDIENNYDYANLVINGKNIVLTNNK